MASPLNGYVLWWSPQRRRNGTSSQLCLQLLVGATSVHGGAVSLGLGLWGNNGSGRISDD